MQRLRTLPDEMLCRVVELRLRHLLSLFERGQYLCIALEQGVHHAGHLTGHAPDNGHGAFPLAFAGVIVSFCGKQALVEFGPAGVMVDSSHRYQIECLFEHAMAALFQHAVVKAHASLEFCGRPPTETLKLCLRLKIADVADVGKDDRGMRDAHARKREQDTPGAVSAHQLLDLRSECRDVGVQQGKLYNQLRLLGNKAPHTPLVFRANCPACQLLQGGKSARTWARVRAGGTQCKQVCRGYGLRRGKRFAQREGRGRVYVPKDLLQFGKQFISDGGQLVFALRRLAHQFLPVLHQAAQKRGGGRWWDNRAGALGLIQHGDMQLDLMVQEDGQCLRVTLICLGARDVFAHMDTVDSNSLLMQELFERRPIVAGALHQHVNLRRRRVSGEGGVELLKPGARLRKGEGRTVLKASVLAQQGRGNQGGDVMAFAQVNAHVETLGRHGASSLSDFTEASENVMKGGCAGNVAVYRSYTDQGSRPTR